jgi:hypothetical protein
VLRLASWLDRVDSQPAPLRDQLVQAEIHRIMGRYWRQSAAGALSLSVRHQDLHAGEALRV